MLSVLFLSFCDFKLYHAFKECDQEDVPLLGDDIQTLLLKVENLKFNTIVNRYLPGPELISTILRAFKWFKKTSNSFAADPIPFSIEITIEDLDENLSPMTPSAKLPITTLMNTTNADINLKDFIPANQYYEQWR